METHVKQQDQILQRKSSIKHCFACGEIMFIQLILFCVSHCVLIANVTKSLLQISVDWLVFHSHLDQVCTRNVLRLYRSETSNTGLCFGIVRLDLWPSAVGQLFYLVSFSRSCLMKLLASSLVLLKSSSSNSQFIAEMFPSVSCFVSPRKGDAPLKLKHQHRHSHTHRDCPR